MSIGIIHPKDVQNQSQREAGVEGERRKDFQLTILKDRRRRWIRVAQRALLEILLAQGTCTADDYISAIVTADDIDPRWQGAIPNGLAIAGIIRRKGVVKSCRPTRHASLISVWELVDREAAERWLIDHPAPADVVTSDPAERSRTPNAGQTTPVNTEQQQGPKPAANDSTPSVDDPTNKKPIVQRCLFDAAAGGPNVVN